jgi:hypothetical protein
MELKSYLGFPPYILNIYGLCILRFPFIAWQN